MGKEHTTKKAFHTRGFTTLSLTWIFLVLVVTGVVLYASPKGRVAHWTGWTVLGLDKEQWGELHMVAALILTIAAAFHLYFNWRTFVTYFKKSAQKGMNLKHEFAAATGITALLVVGTVANVPPLDRVAAWNADIKDSWEAKASALPYPHAEESSLAEFAKRTGVPVESLMQGLEEKGVEAPNPGVKIKDLAAHNGMSPSELFGSLPGVKTKASGAGIDGPGGGHGMGLGRKALSQVCEEMGVSVDQALAALQAEGIEAKQDQSLRDLAEIADRAPREIYDMIAAPE